MDDSELNDASDGSLAARADSERLVLLTSVFILGACGLVYELVAGATASYLMGDSVTQYSLVIGVFLSAMGVGSQLTRWVRGDLLGAFVVIQLTVALIGGFSSFILFAAFPIVESLTPVVLLVSFIIGAFIGMELPLLIRLLREGAALRVNLAHAMSFDYIGALLASIAFPFVLLPQLGLVRAAIASGLLNLLIAALCTLLFRDRLPRFRPLLAANFAVGAALVVGFIVAERTTSLLEDSLYQDEIILAKTTPYQRIVVTRWRGDLRLHLNGHLQFSTADEYRYHESLVLPALSHTRAGDGGLRVLVLGGGDGLAIRELFKHGDIAAVDLVDLDEEVVRLFRDVPDLAALNGGCLSDERVTPHYADAMAYLRTYDGAPYDLILMDLPDPGTVGTNKLYTKSFFGMALQALKPGGILATQASSPFYATKAFWCIVHTMESAAAALAETGAVPRRTVPYHVNIPSFGDWGFILLAPEYARPDPAMTFEECRFYTPEVFRRARVFAPDIAEVETEINTLSHPRLMEYYLKGWRRWNE